MKISSEILRRISGFLLIFLAFYDKISRLGVRRCERLLPGNTEPGKGIFAEYVRKSGEAYPAGSVRFFQFDISVVSFLPCFSLVIPADSAFFIGREKERTSPCWIGQPCFCKSFCGTIFPLSVKETCRTKSEKEASYNGSEREDQSPSQEL